MVLLWVTVLLPVLLGIAALAIDAAYVFNYRSRAQAAADAAALAGSYLVLDGTAQEVQDAGVAAARANFTVGGASGVNIDNIVIERGVWDCSGVTYPASCFTATNTSPSAVRASVSLGDSGASGIQLFFARAIGFSDIEVNVEAVANVAGGGNPENCIVALDPDDDDALVANGNVVVNLQDCGIKVNSDGSAGPGNNPAQIGADLGNADINITGEGAFESVGQVNIGPQGGIYHDEDEDGTFQEVQPTEGATPITDPYGSLDPLAAGGSDLPCDNTNFSQNGGGTLSPGVYCGGLSISGSGDVQFQPGLYVIQDGDFSVSGSVNLASQAGGVTFVLHDPGQYDDYSFKLTGTGNYTLSAMTTGTATSEGYADFAGFLFWDDPDRTNCDERSEFETLNCDDPVHQFSGDGNMQFTGGVYAPFAETKINGNINGGSGGDGCFLVLSNTIEIDGGGGPSTTLNFSTNQCENLFPGSGLLIDDRYALVE